MDLLKPRLKRGQIVVGNLCQTRDAHFSRRIVRISSTEGKRYALVKHICGTNLDYVSEEELQVIEEKLFSERYSYIPTSKEWFPSPSGFDNKGYSFADYFWLTIEHLNPF